MASTLSSPLFADITLAATINMLAKYLSILTLIIGLAGGSVLTKWATPKTVCPKIEIPACPDCNCPPTLGSEFEKVKGKYVTLNLSQHYQVHANGDSLLLVKFEEAVAKAVEEKLLTLKISRCK